jgi:DNA invertase Pin-like site-specific DNA recombinase
MSGAPREGLIYVRQSRHKESERTVSPEVQEQACRQLPGIRDCDVLEVYRDLDISGKSVAKRPSFQRFLERIQRKPPDVVGVYDQSRTFRNTTEALDFYALMERLSNVQVVFSIGHFERSPVGEFSYTTLAAAHTMERKMTGAKISSAYRYLNAQGAPTGQPPYGYERGDDGLVAVEMEASVVRRIFDMYSSGSWSANAIAGRLNDEGVARPRARSAYGWLPDTVVDTLRNVAYVGKTYSESRAKRRGDLIAAQWPAIVDEHVFWHVQELMGERRVRRPVAGRSYAFGRLLYCTRCGEAMRSLTNQGSVYYHCRRDISPRCPAPPLREDVALAWAAALLDRLETLQPDSVAAAIRCARTGGGDRTASVEQVQASLDRLEKLFVWGHVDEGEYLSRRKQLTDLKAELSGPLSQPATRIEVAGIGQAWRVADAAQRRRLLGVFFEKLYVVDGDITKYVARRDHRDQVEALVSLAVGDGLVFDRPVTGRGANLSREARSGPQVCGLRGKGGIRTLEGASHPLPA